MVECTGRADPVVSRRSADKTSGQIATGRHRALERRVARDILADQFCILRIAGDDSPVVMNHRDRGVAAEGERADEILEMGWLDAPAGEADQLAVAVDDLAGEHGGPHAGYLADDGFDDDVGRRLSRGEFAEIAPVADLDILDRPHLGGIDQPALLVEDVQCADMGKRGETAAQHLVGGQQRHLPFERVGRIHPAGANVADDVFVDVLQIGQLLVEVPRQQQRGVGQFAFGDLDGAFAKLHGEIGGAERDRQHQRGAAHDQPLDRAHPAANQRPRFR